MGGEDWILTGIVGRGAFLKNDDFMTPALAFDGTRKASEATANDDDFDFLRWRWIHKQNRRHSQKRRRANRQ